MYIGAYTRIHPHTHICECACMNLNIYTNEYGLVSLEYIHHI